MSSLTTHHSPLATPLKIGHRGAAGHAPENTLASFKRAFELGADSVECDVHLCKSGEAVVIHDETLKRTTGARGRVADFTLAELKKLDAGNGERIPTLEELLSEIAARGSVYIEIKAEEAAVAVAAIVQHFAEEKHFGYEKFPVISFQEKPLVRIKSINQKILTGATPGEKKSSLTPAFIARAQSLGMWSVNPCIKYLGSEFVDAAHAAGLKVITWTANNPRDISRAKSLGVDGIISDYPDRL